MSFSCLFSKKAIAGAQIRVCLSTTLVQLGEWTVMVLNDHEGIFDPRAVVGNCDQVSGLDNTKSHTVLVLKMGGIESCDSAISTTCAMHTAPLLGVRAVLESGCSSNSRDTAVSFADVDRAHGVGVVVLARFIATHGISCFIVVNVTSIVNIDTCHNL